MMRIHQLILTNKQNAHLFPMSAFFLRTHSLEVYDSPPRPTNSINPRVLADAVIEALLLFIRGFRLLNKFAFVEGLVQILQKLSI